MIAAFAMNSIERVMAKMAADNAKKFKDTRAVHTFSERCVLMTWPLQFKLAAPALQESEAKPRY